jgi:hypothetical protein
LLECQITKEIVEIYLSHYNEIQNKLQAIKEAINESFNLESILMLDIKSQTSSHMIKTILDHHKLKVDASNLETKI